MTFEKPIYDSLSYRTWKTSYEIREELQRGTEEQKSIRVPFISINIWLDIFEKRGLAESRYRDLSPEELDKRGGARAKEYRKVSGGRGARTSTRESDVGLEGLSLA